MYKENKNLIGTPRYASLGNHLGKEQGCRDDLEALCYIWIRWVRGTLPWQGQNVPEQERRECNEKQGRYKYSYITNRKLQMKPSELFQGLPDCFQEYFRIVRNLSFDEAPPYQVLRSLLIDEAKRRGLSSDSAFDWEVLGKSEQGRMGSGRGGRPIVPRLRRDISPQQTTSSPYSLSQRAPHRSRQGRR